VHLKGRITSNGESIGGEIVVIDPAPQLSVTSHRTDSKGAFEFDVPARPGMLLIARADGYISSERELRQMPASMPT